MFSPSYYIPHNEDRVISVCCEIENMQIHGCFYMKNSYVKFAFLSFPGLMINYRFQEEGCGKLSATSTDMPVQAVHLSFVTHHLENTTLMYCPGNSEGKVLEHYNIHLS